MIQSKRLVLLAGAALGFAGVANAADQAVATSTVNRDEVRAVVAEMMADAETRSSLLQGGASAGHDGKPGGKFFIASPDGNFRLNIGGQLQIRYLLNFRDSGNTVPPRAGDDFEPGFQMTRTKLDFSGNVINPDWTYRIIGAFSKDGGTFTLEDAFINYNFGNGVKFQLGQFKLPFLREELVSDRRQLAADRSQVNEVFNQDWAKGVQLSYESEDWRAYAAFSDGFATRNTDYFSASNADYALTGRFEYKFAGDWRQFEDFTAEQGGDFGALFGAAVHWQQSANSGLPTDTDLDYLSYTADLSLEGDSWNLFVAGVGRHTEARNAGPDPDDTDDFGVVVQGGYRFLKDTEVFARWDAIFPDDNRNIDKDAFNFITFGVNQYYAGHAAKATIDCVIALDETRQLSGFSPFANGGFPSATTGVLGTSKDNEVVVRFQFQLLF